MNRVKAYWQWETGPPQPGDTITVHDKEGGTTEAVIEDVLGLTNTPQGRPRLECTVRRDWR